MNKPKIVDLTHSLTQIMPTWSGGCDFEHPMKSDHNKADLYMFRKYTIAAQEGVGTHMDAPVHCSPSGKSVHDFTVDDLYSPCFVIDVSDRNQDDYKVSAEDVVSFEKHHGQIAPNSFVIFYTGWDRYWNDPAKYRNHFVFPSVSVEAAKLLLDRDVTGIGIDTLSPDTGPDFPVHKLMLEAGKYMVENVANAGKLPKTGSFTFLGAMKIENGAEAPVRLVGFIYEDKDE